MQVAEHSERGGASSGIARTGVERDETRFVGAERDERAARQVRQRPPRVYRHGCGSGALAAKLGWQRIDIHMELHASGLPALLHARIIQRPFFARKMVQP